MLKVWGKFSMDSAGSFGACAKCFENLGILAYFILKFVGPSLDFGMGRSTLGHDCATHGMPRVCRLGGFGRACPCHPHPSIHAAMGRLLGEHPLPCGPSSSQEDTSKPLMASHSPTGHHGMSGAHPSPMHHLQTPPPHDTCADLHKCKDHHKYGGGAGPLVLHQALGGSQHPQWPSCGHVEGPPKGETPMGVS